MLSIFWTEIFSLATLFIMGVMISKEAFWTPLKCWGTVSAIICILGSSLWVSSIMLLIVHIVIAVVSHLIKHTSLFDSFPYYMVYINLTGLVLSLMTALFHRIKKTKK